MSKTKVGVLGVGNMGANHARIYKTLPHLCEFSGVYDSDAERCRKVASLHGVRAFDNFDEFLDSVDALSVVVPTCCHFAAACAAIERGKHLLIEKPIAQSSGQGRELVRLAREKGTILHVGHVERFNPAVMLLPEILCGKQIIALDFRRMSPFDPRVKDVDVVADLMIHDIDVLRFLLPGEIAKVEATGSAPASLGRCDHAVATMQLAGGVIAHLTASRVTEQKIRSLSITAREAYIELDYIERKILIARATQLNFSGDGEQTYRQESIIEKVFVPNHEPLMLEIESFLRCVQAGADDAAPVPYVSGEDGVKALTIVEHIQSCLYPGAHAAQSN